MDGKMVPVAQLVLKKGVSVNNIEIIQEVNRLCSEELDDDCIPYAYKIVDAFPVKNSGKRNIEEIKKDKSNYRDINGNQIMFTWVGECFDNYIMYFS